MKRFAIMTVALFGLAACGGSEKTTETAPLPPDPQTASDTPAEPPAPAPDTPAPTPAPDAAPYEPTAEEQAKLQELLGVIQAIGDAAEANQGDCGAVGNSIVQITQDNEAVFQWAETMGSDPQKARWLDATATGNEAAVAAVTKIQTAAQACQNDPAFQQAMQQAGMM